MGKRGTYTGESPTDRSISVMERFMKKQEKKRGIQNKLPARRKDPNVSIDLWPLKDQIEYYETRSLEQKFDDQYSSKDKWITEIREMSKVYPSTFTDYVNKLRDVIDELYNNKVLPREAIIELRKHGVY